MICECKVLNLSLHFSMSFLFSLSKKLMSHCFYLYGSTIGGRRRQVADVFCHAVEIWLGFACAEGSICDYQRGSRKKSCSCCLFRLVFVLFFCFFSHQSAQRNPKISSKEDRSVQYLILIILIL